MKDDLPRVNTLRKFLASLLAFAGLSFALVTPTTIADITGDGSAHQLASSGTARWIQFVAPAANSATVRVGDSNASSSRGIPLAAGGGQFFPPMTTDGRESTSDRLYSLSAIWYYAANGDKISVTYGK